MIDICKIIYLKEKVFNNENVKNKIFQRHNCVFNNNKKHLSFFPQKLNLMNLFFTFSPLLLSITGIYLYFKYDMMLYGILLSLIGSFIMIIYSDIMTEIIESNNLLTHEDYKDLSQVINKEELQLLISYYENIFYKDERNQRKTYKFNLRDLFNPVLIEDAEALKQINQSKFNTYLDSIYDSEKNWKIKMNNLY